MKLIGRIGALVVLSFAADGWADMPPRMDDSTPGQTAPMRGYFATDPTSTTAELLALPVPKARPVEAKPAQGRQQIGYSRKTELPGSAKALGGSSWIAAGGGLARVVRVSAPTAKALRVGVRLDAVPDGLRIRVASANEWRVNGPAIELASQWVRDTYGTIASVVWTPVTDGSEQVIELWVPDRETARSLTWGIDDVSHIEEQILGPKAAISCHQNYSCTTSSSIQQWGKAVARLLITNSAGSFWCSGALINAATDRLFTTANHCLSTAAEAASIDFDWSYEVSCGGTTRSSAYTRTLGATLLFTDATVDFTLLRTTTTLPSGVVHLGWSVNDLAPEDTVIGIHHPAGDYKSYSTGNFKDVLPSFSYSNADRSKTWSISSNIVFWTSGLTEGGSSGSPLITTGGVLRGTLGGGPRTPSCTADPQFAGYTRFAEIYPRIRSFLETPTARADEPNNAQATLAAQPAAYVSKVINAEINSPGDEDWFRFVLPERGSWTVYTLAEANQPAIDTVGRIYAGDGTTVLQENDDFASIAPNFAVGGTASAGTYYIRVTAKAGVTGKYVLVSQFVPADDHGNTHQSADAMPANGSMSGRIEKSGDADYFYIDVPGAGVLTLSSSGSTDVVGQLFNAQNQILAANDDVSTTNLNFRISGPVQAGRYYLKVTGYDESVTGNYSLSSSFTTAGAQPNYTALWWNDRESGWGVNVSHQGNTLFATLFTYAANGTGMWLVMSDGARQADGSFQGALFRSAGPAFNSVPFTPITAANLTQVGTMRFQFSSENAGTLTYTVNGASVTKAITAMAFQARPVCNWSSFDRSDATNYSDLWWNPSENGWGLNVAHQADIIFATLYNYDSSGQGMWLFMSEGRRSGTRTYSGSLFRATGPAFNSVPFTPITPSNLTQVGTMTLTFSNGNAATLAYSVNGAQVSKSIQRLRIASPAPLCSQ